MSMIIDGIEFNLPVGVSAFKFDDSDSTSPNYHGVSKLKAVDVIIELSNCYYFVEIKDYTSPGCVYINKIKDSQDPKYLPRALKEKYIDSWAYRAAEGKVDKPIAYVMLLEFPGSDSASLLQMNSLMQQRLPVGMVGPRWKTELLRQLFVVDIKTWNSKLAGILGSCKKV